MAAFGVGPIDRGLLELVKEANTVTVRFAPNSETIQHLSTQIDPVTLMEFDLDAEIVRIYPVETLPQTGRFAQQKYGKIKTICVPMNERTLPSTVEDVEGFLNALPKALTRNWQLGLGVPRDYRGIVSKIEELTDCTEIELVRDDRLQVGTTALTIPLSKLDEIRSSIDLIRGRGQTAVQNVVDASTHNWVAAFTGHPPKDYRRARNAMIKAFAAAAAGDEQLSEDDWTELRNILQRETRVASSAGPEAVSKLRSDLELVELEGLISHFEELLAGSHQEKRWQKFLKANPFILSFAFGYPVVLIQDEASVGGRKLSGQGEKVTDFLTMNPTTNNVAIFEIKTPSTSLLRVGKEYRSGVYAPSKDLAGSITQALDQRYQLLKSFSVKKDVSRMFDIESYAVRMCVIIGTTPKVPDEVKSFELFRSSLKDVEVITFDELLEKVKLLRKLLKSESSVASEVETESADVLGSAEGSM